MIDLYPPRRDLDEVMEFVGGLRLSNCNARPPPAIRVGSSYLGAGTGLGKVRYEGTPIPEPATAPLGSLGHLALLRRHR